MDTRSDKEHPSARLALFAVWVVIALAFGFAFGTIRSTELADAAVAETRAAVAAGEEASALAAVWKLRAEEASDTACGLAIELAIAKQDVAYYRGVAETQSEVIGRLVTP